MDDLWVQEASPGGEPALEPAYDDGGDGGAWPGDADPGLGVAAGDGVSGAALGGGIGVGAAVMYPAVGRDGTPGVFITVPITNDSDKDLPHGGLTMTAEASPDGSQGEQSASMSIPIAALPRGHTVDGSALLELDPGSWTVRVYVRTTADDVVIIQEQAVTVPGSPRYHAIDFDDSHQVALGLEIVDVRVASLSFYQVHYSVTNRSHQPVPAGLPVFGSISDDEGFSSSQSFELQQPCPPGASTAHMLTLEARSRAGRFVAEIILDPGGPSETSRSVTVTTDASGAVTGFG